AMKIGNGPEWIEFQIEMNESVVIAPQVVDSEAHAHANSELLHDQEVLNESEDELTNDIMHEQSHENISSGNNVRKSTRQTYTPKRFDDFIMLQEVENPQLEEEPANYDEAKDDENWKKKMRGRKTSKATIESMNSSRVPDEKNDKLFDKNIANVVKVLEAGNDSTSGSSNVVSLPPETNVSPVASSLVNIDSQMLTEKKVTSPVVSSSVNTGSQILTERKAMSPVVSSSVNTNSQMLTERKVTSPVASSSVNNGSHMLTERKVMSRVNSSKKPPLPSVSRSRPVKPISEMDSKIATLNSISRLCLLIVVAVFVSVVLWMSFTISVTESADLDSDPYTNIAIGDEL
ncbi:hypothetical protein M8C21_028764, partial [Ambrosia artemisiifolia]